MHAAPMFSRAAPLRRPAAPPAGPCAAPCVRAARPSRAPPWRCGCAAKRCAPPSAQAPQAGASTSSALNAPLGEQHLSARAALGGVEELAEPRELRVVGALPEWLAGTYLRNGPGMYEDAAGNILTHMFDGYGAVLRVRFEGGRVWVSQRFLQSGAYKAASAGTMRFREFNTAPTHSSALGKAREVAATVLGAVGVGEGLTDNASVNVVPFGDRTALALTETASGAYLVDADTLATKERLTLQPGDGMPGSLTTAHPCVQRDGALLNFVTEVGLGLSLYRMRPVQRSPARRELVARVALAEPFAPSWMHDFAATENHALLCEWPIRFDMSRMLLGNGSAPTPFDWRGDAPTRLHLVRLSDGNVDTYELPAAFAFHFAGAHEDGEHLHVFGAVCEDPQIVEALALDRCRAAPGEPEHKPIPVASLRRISVPLRRAPGARATMTEVSPPAGKRGSGFAEFPCVNETWRDFGRSAVRYVWALHAVGGSNLGNALVKVDTRDRTAKVWRRPDFIPGEPIFVPRPDGEAEDDGVLMACTHGPDGKASFVVLDASTMEELASCEADVTLGYGFHGTMLSDV